MSAASRLCAAAAAGALALGLAACGDSPEDTAHDNGKAVGQALQDLSQAGDPAAVQAAAGELRTAVANVDDDVGDRVRNQVAVQRDGLNKAIGQVRTAATASNPDAAAQARSELEGQVGELRSQAASFASTNDSVTNSFWDGVRDGYDD
jgi:hypothetical protein